MSGRRPLLALLVAAALGMPGCASYVAYERGLPKRVEVVRRAGKPQTRLHIQRTAADQVEIAVLKRRLINARRRVVYNTIEARGDWNPNLLWELLEIPYGIVALPVLATIIPFGVYDFPDSPTMKQDHFRNRMALIFGFINPAQSVISPKFVRDPDPDREVFFSKPVSTSYHVSLPQPQVVVSYRVIGPDGRQVRLGEGKSDRFGRVIINGLPAGPLRVEAAAGGNRAVTTVRASPAKTPLPADGEVP